MVENRSEIPANIYNDLVELIRNDKAEYYIANRYSTIRGVK